MQSLQYFVPCSLRNLGTAKKFFCMRTNILDTYSFFSDNGCRLFKEWFFFPQLTGREGVYDNYR